MIPTDGNDLHKEVRLHAMNGQDQKHVKKMIAPIVITILVVVYYMIYFCVIISMMKHMAAIVLLGVIPVALAAVMIYVCMQRMDEIRSGEEDDLSEY